MIVANDDPTANYLLVKLAHVCRLVNSQAGLLTDDHLARMLAIHTQSVAQLVAMLRERDAQEVLDRLTAALTAAIAAADE